ncbi:MAG: DUF4394 domain-containing protein [Gammaproteobacteria bacterium]
MPLGFSGYGLILTTLLVTAIRTGAAAPASPVGLVGLSDQNELVLFASDRPAEVKRIDVSGVSDSLLGIDYRPADGRLYGISEASNLYALDVATGGAALVCTLTLPFDGGLRSGFDFNPQSDRLRLLGANGRNLRSHPEIGATAADAPLAYAEQDPHSGTKPTIVAAAYTNSVPNAPSTKLFDIDSGLDLLVLQNPPNDGVLETVGALGIDFDPAAGFDIVSDGKGQDRGFAASHSTLYAIDLETGKATRLGTIGDGRIVLIGLAILSPVSAER